MDRRDFIKHSAAAVAGTSLLLSACGKKKQAAVSHQPSDTPSGEMTKRTNPSTGDKVSLLGFGMMRLPVMGGGTARENPDSPVDQEAVNAMVDYALEHGVNMFDTSPVYCQGLSEMHTGVALARHPRSKYFICTKLSNFDPQTWPASASKAMFEHSLESLQTEYVDYLLMHGLGMGGNGKDATTAFNERYINNGILDWLVEQKRAGRIRNLGFSFHGDLKVFDMLMRWHDEGKYHWDAVLIELNYLDWNHAEQVNPRNPRASYLYEELHKRGISVLVMEPLLGGRLAKQPEAIVRRMRRHNAELTPADWAFRFAGTPDGILSVLSGMTYMEHLQANVKTYSPLQPLSDDEWNFLMQLADDLVEMHTIPCTACNYCMPCPYGLNIPQIFTYYNACIAEGLLPNMLARGSKEFVRNRRAFLVGYDRTVPGLRQADHCIGCDHCLQHCPQRINIPKEMRRIDDLVEILKQS